VRFGLSERHAVGLLALIALCIGGSSFAYTPLNNPRYTIIGVVLTFVLMVQFASFLADVERRPLRADEQLGFVQVFAVHWRRLVEVLVDFGLITGSYFLAYTIRFGWPGTNTQQLVRHETFPIVLAARYLLFIPFGLYRPVWRFAGAKDAVGIGVSVLFSEFLALSIVVLTQNLYDFDRSFFVIDALICMVAITASRFAERALLTGSGAVLDRSARRTLIVGAGRTGRSMMRELSETAGERVVGFVDDNPNLRRRSVYGVRVLGTTAEMTRLLERSKPDIVLVTIPNAPRETLDAVVGACAEADIDCRFVRREIDLDPRVIFGATAE
jgi:FlaA1/EpsC-like NDP-sugar epimerase